MDLDVSVHEPFLCFSGQNSWLHSYFVFMLNISFITSRTTEFSVVLNEPVILESHNC